MIFQYFKLEASFDSLLTPYRVHADKIMVSMNSFLMVVCLGIAPIRDTYLDAMLVGLPTLALSFAFIYRYPGSLLTRIYMGCAFMAFTGLIIHQTGGDIEGHFSAFGLIGVLLYYRDWRTILAATIFIYLHHLFLGYAQTLGVPIYVFDDDRFWLLFGVHVAYFLPFILMMMYLSIWLRKEGYEAQRVLSLAQQIIQGNLLGGEEIDKVDIEKPLIHSVVSMKNRLLDLLKIIPVPTVVVRVDQAKVVNYNEAWIKTLGAINNTSGDFNKSFIWPKDGNWDYLLEKVSRQQGHLLERFEQPLITVDGKNRFCELSVILHENVKPVMAIMTVEDITEHRKAEHTMEKLAYSDLLTGLPNRASLRVELDKCMANWIENQDTFAVVAFDLDGFKPVNDTYGHDAGDEALKAVASRFISAKRQEDMIARMGGDEFVLIIRSCSNVNIIVEIAERFIRSLAEPIHLRGTDTKIWVGTSAGVSIVSSKDMSIDMLLKRADIALYQAKKSGNNSVVCAEIE
jgi:diguanylate cyclase (GGDEF)-like protein